MEEKERSLSPSRRASRVEQVVGRWLRRSRDSNSRERAAGEGKFGTPVGAVAAPIKLTVKLARDPRLDSHGFEISDQCPLLVTEVTAGGPADGRLVQGDQVLTINNIVTDDLSAEQAAEIIRESWDCVTLMVLRHTAGPKSSFMTAEKRARLRSNPVKVHFAEEVVVNGHTQGNSLLFLPNVLKVYLENGQTKAFKFEAKTTVKEIVLTLKEKLSIRSIEYFGLVLEEQYSVNKQLLLHQEEYIQQVVHKKEVHDYRCLFRVCFVPRDPLELLQEDPVAFEYLYLQSVNDVLQERFAVEMKCNTALHLAALHIHERLDSCGQTHRTSLKSITKEWGIENFISPTLLRNMSEKDLKKAIGYHLKKIRALLDPKQKVISATQARLSYLAQLGELQSYGGKCFTATILFQDRESMVNLLVGARYGISQVINQRLNIIVVLTEFTSITRVDLLPESERVSLVKIYLQDVKQITLLMESAAAKDFSCLVTGYCKLHLDPALTVFSWSSPAKMYRIPTEAGYPQDGGDLDDFSIVDSSGNVLVDFHFSIDDARVMPLREEEDGMKGNKNEEEEEVEANGSKVADEAAGDRGNEEEDETLNLCHSRSQSLENLDDDDLLTCSAGEPSSIDASHPYLLDTSILEMELDGDGIIHGLENTEQKNEAFLCFRDFSSMADSLPSPPEATDEEDERQRINLGHFSEGGLTKGDDDVERPTSSALTLDVGDLPEHPEPAQARLQVMPQDLRPAPVLQPSPSFVDSSSEDEFFDANDKFVPSAAGQETSVIRKDRAGMTRTLNLHNLSCTEQEREENERDQMSTPPATSSVVKKLRKRHFFAENYTSQVSFPVTERENQMVDEDQLGRFDNDPSNCSLENEPFHHPEPPIHSGSHLPGSPGNSTSEKLIQNNQLSFDLLEMNPDTLEYKLFNGSPVVLAEYSQVDPEAKNGNKCLEHFSGSVEETVSSDSVVLNSSEASNKGLPSSEKQSSLSCTLGGQDGKARYSEVQMSPLQLTHSPQFIPTNTSVFSSRSSEETQGAEDNEAGLEAESQSVTADQWTNDSSCLVMVSSRRISLSFESILLVETEASDIVEASSVTTNETTNTNSQRRSLGLVGRLSNSALRKKIRKLPCCLSRSQETLNTLGSCTDKTTSERHMDESQVATEVTEVTEASTADVEEPSELTEEVIEMPTEESEDDPKLLKVVTENRSDTDTFCHRLCSDVERSESKMLQLCKHPDVGMCNIGSAILSREDESEDVGDHMTEVLQEPKELYRDLKPCESKQPQPLPHPYTKGMVEFMPPPVLLVSRTPQEHCGCQSYSNCFSRQTDRRNLDEEEMPDQTQGREGTCLTVPSMYPASSIPPFSRVVLPCSSSSELSPLLSPLDPADCSPPDSLQEVLNQLRGRHYRVPGGFSLLQQDLLELLTILEAEPQGRGQHHWETCVAHLSENKHLLHAEARKLMSNCQRVIRVGQGPDEMLRTLSESFHTLVQLASMCLCFSSCCQCEGSLTKVLGSLREITKAYREFSQEAELACGRKSCQDVSIKVLARQCTALTASVFCLTQLYCTLAAL
ncbi:FERM and PDZ domain-containing protein 1-like isoform X1 [Paramormyrops kingsleyae]|uniref:FERM and PDZ domain-containing protein 1-like isoform X1 n=1 Tax=Paramormyrops kingsleyae TaxID=1676925 RepID=UPI003B971BD9